MEDAQSLKIVVVDDEAAIRRTVSEFLQDQSHEVQAFSRGADALEYLNQEEVDIIISDIRMPGMDGFEVLEEVRRVAPTTEVILVTGYGDLDGAVRALRHGAFDFFTKPIHLRELMLSLERTTRFHALRREKDFYKENLQRLNRESQRDYDLEQIIGRSRAIQAVKELIKTLQETDATTVLIAGESGTGKELVARAVHYGSQRAQGPFITVNCTAMPDTLIESELYGHEQGAFTDAKERRKGQFELASSGTIFLDEIGDMSLAGQSKVLRTIEEREIRRVGGSVGIPIDVRILSATNKNLTRAIDAHEFREDLYYRLNTFVIYIPPLRDRPEDIATLAQHFCTRFSNELRKPVQGFASDAMTLLREMAFPGNVRQLRNLVERAVILCKSNWITPEELMAHQDPFDRDCTIAGDDLKLETMEKRFIREALQRTGGNKVKAADLLGISRDALRRRLGAYGLSSTNEGQAVDAGSQSFPTESIPTAQ